MNKISPFWKQKEYYEVSAIASKNETHPAVIAIKNTATKSKKILDLGCGDGTRIGNLKVSGEKYGIDISSFAISRAKKKYPSVNFLKGDIENLRFGDEFFDFAYSMFVLEHTQNPEKVIKEAARVLKKEGILIFACPNYGAPNRRSPNSEENKFFKLFNGLVNQNKMGLDWKKVKPRLKGKYFIDADTVTEPYIEPLLSYLKKLKFAIIEASSLWEIDDFSINQVLFKFLGQMGIEPFVWWGPQVFVLAKKR